MAFPFRSQFVDWGTANADIVRDLLRQEDVKHAAEQSRIAGMSAALLDLAGACLARKPQPRSVHRSRHPAPAEPMRRE